jgi:hypothetical protein
MIEAAAEPGAAGRKKGNWKMGTKLRKAARKVASKGGMLLLGLSLGVCLGLSYPALSKESGEEVNPMASVLYTIAQLAIDTETNAARIVELTERLEELEAATEDLTTREK